MDLFSQLPLDFARGAASVSELSSTSFLHLADTQSTVIDDAAGISHLENQDCSILSPSAYPPTDYFGCPAPLPGSYPHSSGSGANSAALEASLLDTLDEGREWKWSERNVSHRCTAV